jgi:hypothetical protein
LVSAVLSNNKNVMNFLKLVFSEIISENAVQRMFSIGARQACVSF